MSGTAPVDRLLRETEALEACEGFWAMMDPDCGIDERTLNPAKVSSDGNRVWKADERWRRWSVPRGVIPDKSCASRDESFGLSVS